ncbi:MAG: methylmalonyl Co-A mutase-associated GTPase MeaB [Candidatus Hodarchaeota archaeon]
MDVQKLVESLFKGDVASISRLISLAENDFSKAEEISRIIYPHTGKSHIVGITGPPGSGKSSLVNKLALRWRDRGKTIGIIAVDPSSPYSGGALLGDRVRMRDIVGVDGVFIRSMATRGSLGGLARATRDAVNILDASGKNIVIVETVGAGQSEVAIMKVAQTIVMVLCPGLGDDIQAMKAGTTEIADIFVINKSDKPEAMETAYELERVLDYEGLVESKQGWVPPVISTSSTKNIGIEQLLDKIEEHKKFLASMNAKLLDEKRAIMELTETLRVKVEEEALKKAKESAMFNGLIRKIVRKKIDPYQAANAILREYLK